MLLYVLCGAAVVAGLVGLVAGLVGSDRPEDAAPSAPALRLHTLWYGSPGTAAPRVLRLRRIQVAVSAVGGPLMWLFSGVPLARASDARRRAMLPGFLRGPRRGTSISARLRR